MASFKERLKELREEKQISREELAKAVKLSYWAIAKYEAGERTPDFETVQRLADFFGVSVDYLLGRTDVRETPEQKIEAAVSSDQELMEFWQELSKREDLQLLFKQVRVLPASSIRRIIRYIKMVEDEEAKED